MKQEYDKYTDEDKLVWKILFERQMENLLNTASSEYLNGIEKTEFKSDKIPDFMELNLLLTKQTGWSLEVVPGIIPQKDFFQFLSERKFSASTWLRKMSQLDYLEEPDMFHDVYGHVPLLTNLDFCSFFEGLSQIAIENIENPVIIEMLGRLYWFTVEFGLIFENNKLKIYGAGIVSSSGETKFCLGKGPKHVSYNVHEILSTPYYNDRIQDKYFVIDSYVQLYNSLDEIKLLVDKVKYENENYFFSSHPFCKEGA